MLPGRGLLAVEPEGQALGAAARLDELGQPERPDRVAGSRCKARASLGAPSFRITVRPTTTALQLNETASSAETSIRRGIRSAEDRAAVVVEGAGVVDRRVLGQRAEAGVEVIEPGIDQLQRQDLDAEPLADPVVAPRVAPEPVAGEERLAAEEGVARPLEVAARRAA